MQAMSEDDKDRIALILTGPTLLIAAFGGSTWWIKAKGLQATAWLMDNNILVAKDQAMIPILDAGLDLPRIALIVAVGVLLLGFSILMLRNAIRRRWR